MNTEKEIIGTGWAFPPQFDPDTNTTVMAAGVEDINQSLYILFTTELGERVMQPNYGTAMKSMILSFRSASCLVTRASSVNMITNGRSMSRSGQGRAPGSGQPADPAMAQQSCGVCCGTQPGAFFGCLAFAMPPESAHESLRDCSAPRQTTTGQCSPSVTVALSPRAAAGAPARSGP